MLKNSQKRLVATTLVLLFAPAGCRMDNPDDKNPMILLLEKLKGDSPQEMRRKLLEQLSSPDADLRRQGVIMLGDGEAASWEVTPKILGIMAAGDDNPQVRAAAVGVLAKIDDSEHLISVLEDAAGDADQLVRSEAILALGRRGALDGSSILMERLANDRETSIRIRSAELLKAYPQRKVVRALLAALEDEDFGVVYTARKSLAELTGKDFGYDLAAWQGWMAGTEGVFGD